jgi:hypothetical protein
MWFVTSQENGARALGLQGVLGLGSYRTAWSWLHKLRRTRVRSGRDRLSGWVEVDETCRGSPELGQSRGGCCRQGSSGQGIDCPGGAGGRERHWSNTHARGPAPLCRQPPSVCSGSHRARQHNSYRRLAGLRGIGEEGIRSRGDVGPETTTERSFHSPPVSGTAGRFASEAVAGRYTPRAMSHDHLLYYLDEFTFRFNRRKSKSRRAVPPPRATGCGHRPNNLCPHCQTLQIAPLQTTTCRDYLSQVHTRFSRFGELFEEYRLSVSGLLRSWRVK